MTGLEGMVDRKGQREERRRRMCCSYVGGGLGVRYATIRWELNSTLCIGHVLAEILKETYRSDRPEVMVRADAAEASSLTHDRDAF